MKNSDPLALIGAESSIEQMVATGALDENAYSKCVLTLASEWLCVHHDTDKSLVLINRVKPEYFDNHIVDQLRGDIMFRAAMVELVHRLVSLGLTLEHDSEINMTRASA